MAGVDSTVDDAEAAVLSKELNEALLHKDELTRGVLSSVTADMQGTFKAFADDKRQPLSGLQEGAAVLATKAAPASAGSFKKTILAIGRATAKASGTRGAEVSGEEALAFAAVAAALGVQL